MSLRNTPNQYWGHNPPPAECCMSITCSALDKASFKRYVESLAKEGLYYSHDNTKRIVTLAFGTPHERQMHEEILRYHALANGALIETK